MGGNRMGVKLYDIDCAHGRLAIMARPRGNDWLDDDISALRKAGITTIVSLLADDEVSELGLQDESMLCRRHEMDFLRYPIEDRRIPSDLASAHLVITTLSNMLISESAVALHCRAGIGRAAMMAAAILFHLGTGVDSAWRLIAQARGMAVPDTTEQREWVAKYVEHFGQKQM
jgi:protein-tyrosine phosphatase